MILYIILQTPNIYKTINNKLNVMNSSNILIQKGFAIKNV